MRLGVRAALPGAPPVVTAMMAAMDVVAITGGIVVLGDPLAACAGARTGQLAALALAALSAAVVLGDAAPRSQPPAAHELPGLPRGRDPELRPRVGRVGARPGVRAADELQVGDRRPVAAPLPVEA